MSGLLICLLCYWQVFNYSDSRTVEEICSNSTKLISFIDLCGHHKYLKTTVFGLTGYSPDFAMLVVSATSGIGLSYYPQTCFNFVTKIPQLKGSNMTKMMGILWNLISVVQM